MQGFPAASSKFENVHGIIICCFTTTPNEAWFFFAPICGLHSIPTNLQQAKRFPANAPLAPFEERSLRALSKPYLRAEIFVALSIPNTTYLPHHVCKYQ